VFYGSKHSKSKLFHYADCEYANRIAGSNKVEFQSIDEAKSQGYKFCPHCCMVGRQYRQDRKAIDGFCRKYGLRHYIFDGDMYVISDEDTAWRISENGKGLYLLHESKSHIDYDRETTAYEKRDYHVQHMPMTTIMGYLSNILSHDLYEERKSEERRREREKRSEEVRSIRTVQRQISRQNHKKNRSLEGHSQKRRRSKQQLRALAAAFTDYRSARAANI
jgi:hypothetical protein